jgi:O-antigen/teichoic acid export membrane protein
MIVGFVATSFNQAWSPYLFQALAENDSGRKVRLVQFTYVYFAAIVGLAIVVSALAPWFLRFFVDDAFRDSTQYVPWVALGYAANGMYFMVANYIFVAKKTHLLAFVTLTGAGCNLLLNYLWVPSWGALGAAQATTVSFLVSFILTWLLSARVYPMPWRVWNQPSGA